MKTTTCLTLRRSLILAILFLLSSAVLTAQVKIHEKVEIAPKAPNIGTIKANDVPGLSNSFILKYPANVELLIPLDGDNYFGNVSCSNGQTVNIYRYIDGPPLSWYYLGIVPKGTGFMFNNLSDGFLIVDSSYADGLGNGWIDDCNAKIYFYYNDPIYSSYFEFHSYRADFCPPVNIFMNIDNSKLPYEESKEIPIGLTDGCGNHTQELGPTPVKYYVKITNGKEWGYVYNQATGQYGDSIVCTASDCDTSFIFLAMSQQPSEDQQVSLRVWSENTSFIPATGIITVQSTKCMLLSVVKSKINPGDTASISMMQNLEDGTSIPYPADQLFSIRLNTGGKWYGTLLCPATGDTGQVLKGLQQPFEFIADSIITADSVVVEIDANTQIVEALPSSIGIGEDTLQSHTSVMASTESKTKHIAQPVPNEMNRKNIEASIKKLQSLLDKGIAKKVDEKQRLAYGIKKLKAQLAAYKTAVNPTKKQSSLVNKIQTSLSFAGETGCTGIDTVTIKKPKLKIVEHSPWTIWPYLPPQNNAPHNRGADRPGYNPKRTFTIRLLKGDGTPYPNQQISIFTKYKEGSGGHDHTGWADTGGHIPAVKALPQDTLQGKIYYKGGKVGQNPLTVTTDANGEAKIDSFIASQASGKFLVTARMVRDTTIMDTVNLQVKVDGFVQFGIGSYWGLTGNNSKRGMNHPINHWCTQKMKDSLEAALKSFYNWTKTKEGGGTEIKLGINDMCLQWGGAFDFPGLWNFNDQHSFHRVGLSVDIDNNGLQTFEENPDPIKRKIKPKVPKLTDRGNQLVDYMKDYGGIKYNEDQIHFGFDNQN